MDKSYHHPHGHQSQHPPLSFITTGGTPYHSYLSWNYGPSSAPPGQGGGGGSGGQPPGRSPHSSNTSSPLSSKYHHRPGYYPRTYQLSPTYLPYNHYPYNSGSGGYLNYLNYNNPKDPYYYYGDSRQQSRAKLQHLSNRLHAWKSVSIAISFLALILLTCKLYDVDREINFLQFVATEWLSPVVINREILQQSFAHHQSSSFPNQPVAQALTALPSNHENLYSNFQNSSSHPHHFALPLVISSSSTNSANSHAKPKATGKSSSGSNSNSHHHLGTVTVTNPSSAHQAQSQQQSPPPLPTHPPHHITDPNLSNVIFLVESLREDVDILVVELWSSRTTLVLSLVFVFVYIMSWCWMAYAIRETTSPHDVSLKTVLLLAIFAAVDIAASAGFVMVRVIMYVMRDHYFPRDMRAPVLSAEFNQLAAYTALRLVTLKSSTGVVDIFVSVIVGFLTSLRVYSVICAVSFYRRARKELLNINNLEYIFEKTTPHPANNARQQQIHMLNGLARNGSKSANIKPTDDASPNGFIPKIRLLNAHKDLEHRFSAPGTAEPHSLPVEDEAATSSSSDEDPAVELKIQAADMPPHMQKAAMQSTVHALRTYTTEKHIAESVKQNFDQLYEPTWHCIVGRNWGSCVTHTKSNYIRMLYKDLTILLYKSS